MQKNKKASPVKNVASTKTAAKAQVKKPALAAKKAAPKPAKKAVPVKKAAAKAAPTKAASAKSAPVKSAPAKGKDVKKDVKAAPKKAAPAPAPKAPVKAAPKAAAPVKPAAPVKAAPKKPEAKAETKPEPKVLAKAESAAEVEAKSEAAKPEAAPKAAKAKKSRETEVIDAEPEEEVVLLDAEGRRYCRVKDCDQASTVDGYCRFHYLLFWKNIQNRKSILAEGKLERYIEELTARYPDKYLEMLKKDLRSEKEFLAAIQELEIDEAGVDNDYEDEAQNYLDEVRGMGTEAGGGSERDDEF